MVLYPGLVDQLRYLDRNGDSLGLPRADVWGLVRFVLCADVGMPLGRRGRQLQIEYVAFIALVRHRERVVDFLAGITIATGARRGHHDLVYLIGIDVGDVHSENGGIAYGGGCYVDAVHGLETGAGRDQYLNGYGGAPARGHRPRCAGGRVVPHQPPFTGLYVICIAVRKCGNIADNETYLYGGAARLRVFLCRVHFNPEIIKIDRRDIDRYGAHVVRRILIPREHGGDVYQIASRGRRTPRGEGYEPPLSVIEGDHGREYCLGVGEIGGIRCVIQYLEFHREVLGYVHVARVVDPCLQRETADLVFSIMLEIGYPGADVRHVKDGHVYRHVIIWRVRIIGPCHRIARGDTDYKIPFMRWFPPQIMLRCGQCRYIEPGYISRCIGRRFENARVLILYRKINIDGPGPRIVIIYNLYRYVLDRKTVGIPFIVRWNI